MTKPKRKDQLPLFGGARLPRERVGSAAEAEGVTAGETPPEPEILSVAELDRSLQRLLEVSTSNVRVRGEISGLHRAASRHAYFALKDETEDALIDCVMYRSAPQRAHRRLADGERVVLLGRVTVYPPRGRMQLVAEDVLETARGALLEALERLKAKLAAEGLFAPERKQALPRDPKLIAVLTSPDGAAIHDIVRVAFRRGRVRILLVPTPVQGAGAAERIAEAIARVDRIGAVDAIVVTRGGGSAEDLAAYSEERLVRAVAAAKKPIVSAVGHEVDVSLTDLAADARAATPSQAAELLVPDQGERLAALQHWTARLRRTLGHRLAREQVSLARLRASLGEPRRLLLAEAQRFDELGMRLERALGRQLADRRSRLEGLAHRLTARHPRRVLADRRYQLEALRRRLEARHPRHAIAAARARLGPLGPRLAGAMRQQLGQLRHGLAGRAAHIEALSPLAVLGRGYAVATDSAGHVLRDAAEVAPGERVNVQLHHGQLATRVTKRG